MKKFSLIFFAPHRYSIESCLHAYTSFWLGVKCYSRLHMWADFIFCKPPFFLISKDEIHGIILLAFYQSFQMGSLIKIVDPLSISFPKSAQSTIFFVELTFLLAHYWKF